MNRKSDAIYAVVKDFKHRGVPIDGVGLQMHVPMLDADMPAIAAAASSNIARLTALGVQVHISELDVALAGDSSGRASAGRLETPGRGLLQHRKGMPGQSGLHRDPDLGIHRQVLLDWISFAWRSWARAAFRSSVAAQSSLPRGVGGTLGWTSPCSLREMPSCSPRLRRLQRPRLHL